MAAIPREPKLGALLPQLWNAERVENARRNLPPGVVLPLCSINGDDKMEGGHTSDKMLPCDEPPKMKGSPFPPQVA